ncbi:kinase-like domain-containing protein [Hypomontagnella submonticulosa]|nr:kinase-like domain-containing protein [Hypomontagnella submonticulosa]
MAPTNSETATRSPSDVSASSNIHEAHAENQEHVVRDRNEVAMSSNFKLPETPRYRRAYGLLGDLDENEMPLEELELYLPGGFHPVHIGDVLDGRYEVSHKLGCGGFATVWLCLDLTTHSWKAVKILVAQKSSEACPELKFRKALANLDCVALPEDHFWINGPNGRHLALVLPVLGPSVANMRDIVSDMAIIDQVCRRITESLYCFHGKNICHGDFRPSNILHRLHSIDSLSKEQLWELLGSPFSAEYYHKVHTTKGDDPRPNGPQYAIRAADMRRLQDWIIEDEIAVIDFGVAFEVSDPPKAKSIPDSYAAPELLFGGCPSLSSDIWSLACSILKLQIGKAFENEGREVIGDMEFFLGPLPEEYREAFAKTFPPGDEDGSEEDDSDYEDYRDLVWPRLPIDTDSEKNYLVWTARELQEKRQKMLEDHGYSDLLNAQLGKERDLGGFGRAERRSYSMPRRDVLQLSDLLRRMLKYKPEERLDAAAILDHPWFSRRHDTQEPKPKRKRETSPEIEMDDDTKELVKLIQSVPKHTRKQRMDLRLALSDSMEALQNLIDSYC